MPKEHPRALPIARKPAPTPSNVNFLLTGLRITLAVLLPALGLMLLLEGLMPHKMVTLPLENKSTHILLYRQSASKDVSLREVKAGGREFRIQADDFERYSTDSVVVEQSSLLGLAFNIRPGTQVEMRASNMVHDSPYTLFPLLPLALLLPLLTLFYRRMGKGAWKAALAAYTPLVLLLIFYLTNAAYLE